MRNEVIESEGVTSRQFIGLQHFLKVQETFKKVKTLKYPLVWINFLEENPCTSSVPAQARRFIFECNLKK